MDQTVYLYVELEGETLDIEPLYALFAKCKCYGSPVGDTYYTYDEDGDKRARTRKKAYFLARLSYNTDQPDPVNDIVCEFLNTYCYEGAHLRNLIREQGVKHWCAVSSEAEQLTITLRQNTMRKLVDLGLDIGITVLQKDKVFHR